MKDKRQSKILELIEKYDIETQDELIRRLEEFGFHVTQATVSRDIRELKLIKGASRRGGYKYILPTRHEPATPKFNSALTTSITSVDYAGNLLVVKTYPGLANAVATCIDSLHVSDLLGCVAGDDTIIAAIRTEESAVELCDKLRLMIGSL